MNPNNQMSDGTPVNELPPREHGAQFSKELENVSVVWAVDKATGRQSIIYGISFLKAIIQGVIPPQHAAMTAFAVDFSEASDDLEFLCAAVKVAKGSHEYQGEDTED